MEMQKQKIYRVLRTLSPKQSKSYLKTVMNTNHIPTDNLSSYKNKQKHNDKILINNSQLKSTNRKLNSQNHSHKYIFNHTTVGTPFQKSTMLSYVSTPNEKTYNGNFLTFLSNFDKLKKKRSLKKNNTIMISRKQEKQQRGVQSTEEQNLSWNKIKINFIISGKSYLTKLFDCSVKISQVKSIFVNDMLSEKIKNNFYGMIGLTMVPIQYQIQRLLKDDDFKLQHLLERNLRQINVQPILVKNKLGYDNMQFKDFEINRYLGSGGFSSVYLGRCLLDGEYTALKFIKKSTITSAKKIRMLQNQKNILFTINHSNVIDLLYAFQTQNYIVFGLQYCPYGNLYNFLQRHKQLDEPLAKCIIKQILSGLEYLHQNNILFRDVKLENILFDIEGRIKITDFGLSKPDVQENQITFSYCGSPEYMAPEMLAKSGHSYEVDYYALGILLYQLLYGKSPFYAPKKQDIFAAIINSEPYFPKQPIISKQAKSLIKGLLSKNPKHRIGSLKGIKQINSHPWLRGSQISAKQFLQDQKDILEQSSPLNKLASTQQLKNIKDLFQSEKNYSKPQKYFFQQSFVNKNLYQKVQKNCIVFKRDKSVEKTKTTKKKTNKIL